MCLVFSSLFPFFFFNDTATTEIYTLSLHDALPISWVILNNDGSDRLLQRGFTAVPQPPLSLVDLFRSLRDQIHSGKGERVLSFKESDRKSTRLNSSHSSISYAVFCLKKKKTIKKYT